MRQIMVKIADTGYVEAEFIGGHLSKRELLRAIKAVKVGYRRSVQEYRRKAIRAANLGDKENARTGQNPNKSLNQRLADAASRKSAGESAADSEGSGNGSSASDIASREQTVQS